MSKRNNQLVKHKRNGEEPRARGGSVGDHSQSVYDPPEQDMGEFLEYFIFWFPKFFHDVECIPKVIQQKNKRFYEATKMFATHMAVYSREKKKTNPQYYIRLDPDGLIQLFTDNFRTLMILAGNECKDYWRMNIPVQGVAAHFANSQVGTILRFLGWRYVHKTKQIVKNGSPTESSCYDVMDQWQHEVCSVSTLHPVRAILEGKNILPAPRVLRPGDPVQAS